MTMAKKSIHTSCQRAIIQLLESIQGKYSKWELWQDFIIMSAVSIANAVNTLHREQREQLYLDRAKKYSESELGVFAQMLKEAIEEIERNPEQDLLGELFMALGLSNEWKGQFFTPYHICQMMAAIMLSTDSNDAFAKKGCETDCKQIYSAEERLLVYLPWNLLHQNDTARTHTASG